MPETPAEHAHHLSVLEYRRELSSAISPFERAKLTTLIAREKMLAEEEGWPATPDETIILTV